MREEEQHHRAIQEVFRRHAVLHSGRYQGADGRRPYSRWHARMRGFVLQELRNAPSGSAVLDAGCGNGDFAVDVARSCAGTLEIHGCDLVTDAIALARDSSSDPRLHFSVADVRHLPYPERRFHTTVSLGVLSLVHERDQPAALAELARVTSNVLLLQIHDASSAYFRWIHSGRVEGLPFFPTTPKILGVALSRMGFRRTGIRRVFLLPLLSPLAVVRFERS